MPKVVGTGRVLPPGTRLGKYTLERLLARGGMAELYLARQVSVGGFEKLVALKLVLPHLSTDPEFLEMFLDEARLAGKLDHPNIAQVLDLGHDDGEHFMVMEYVHGINVRGLLARAEEDTAISLDVALAIVVDACRGLHYAHELHDEAGAPLGIVHRDVSPSNLLVRYDGVVKLVDFGIAKAASRNQRTATGVLKGKSGYMSPEQCRGLPLDRRSDIFGLGILLYELTTCQRLFYGDNEFAILNRVVDGEFERPSEVVSGYPAGLENVVLRALDPTVENRFATALALEDALRAFAAGARLELSSNRVAAFMRGLFGDPPPPTASGPPPRTGPLTATLRGRRTRRVALGLGLAGVSLAGAGYLVGTASSSAPTEVPVRASTPAPAGAGSSSSSRGPNMPPEADAAVADPAPTANGDAEALGAGSTPPSAAPIPRPAAPADAEARVEHDAAAAPPAHVDAPSKGARSKRRHKRRGGRPDSTRKPRPGRTPDSMMPRE